VNHLPPDAQALVHEWIPEHGIHWSQKSHHEQAAEISYALRQLGPPISLGRIDRIFGVTKGTTAHHLADCFSYSSLLGDGPAK
jgi:hypothetical protein